MQNLPVNIPDLMTYVPAAVAVGGSAVVATTVVPAVRYARADKLTRASIRRAFVVRRRWGQLARMSGLTVTQQPSQLAMAASQLGKDAKPPKPQEVFPAIKTRADQFGFTVTAKTLPRVGLTQWQAVEEDLRNAWGVERIKLWQPKPGLVQARAFMREPLDATVPSDLTTIDGTPLVKPGALKADSDIVLMYTEDGDPVSINLARSAHGVIAGRTRSGKSITVNTLLGHAALMRDVITIIIDPNLGAVAPWWRTAHLVSSAMDPTEPTEILRWVREECERRQGLFWSSRTDKISKFSKDVPLILLVVDEVANYTLHADRKKREAFDAELLAIASQGAKFGVRLWLLAQKPDANVVRTAIRTNLTGRISHQVDTVEDFLHLFPDGRQLDVTAADRNMPAGVGIASVGEMRTPVRARSVYLPTEHCWTISDAIVEAWGEVRPLPAPKLSFAKEAALRAA